MDEPKPQSALHKRRDETFRIRKRQQRLAAAPSLKTDADLIAEALAAGKVTRLPEGEAANPLKWWSNSKL